MDQPSSPRTRNTYGSDSDDTSSDSSATSYNKTRSTDPVMSSLKFYPSPYSYSFPAVAPRVDPPFYFYDPYNPPQFPPPLYSSSSERRRKKRRKESSSREGKKQSRISAPSQFSVPSESFHFDVAINSQSAPSSSMPPTESERNRSWEDVVNSQVVKAFTDETSRECLKLDEINWEVIGKNMNKDGTLCRNEYEERFGKVEFRKMEDRKIVQIKQIATIPRERVLASNFVTDEEHERILELRASLGPRWTLISAKLGNGKTAEQIRKYCFDLESLGLL